MLNALMYIHTAFRHHLGQRLNDRGVTSVEYALLVVLIAFVMGVGALALGGGLSTLFSNIGATLSGTTVPSP